MMGEGNQPYINDQFYDIALLILKQDVTEAMLPIIYPTVRPYPGQWLWAYGFGINELGLESPFLKKLPMTVLNDSDCDHVVEGLAKRETNWHWNWWKCGFTYDDPLILPKRAVFCAYSNGHGAACYGDSGGPLTDERTQYGILSIAECQPSDFSNARWISKSKMAILVDLSSPKIRLWLRSFDIFV